MTNRTAAAAENNPAVPADPPVNPSNVRIAPTNDNPRGYPPFDLQHVPTYTKNQLHYYHTSRAMLGVDKTELMRQMEERKALLEVIDWDGNTRENTPAGSLPPDPPVPSSSRTLSFDNDSEADSECPAPLPGVKGIKFNPSDITQLRYDSNVAQFNNWLEDLKSAFDGDPGKYPTSRHKIILASMTIDEQLKTTYNSTVRAHKAISTHWRKFRRWIQNVVLRGDSDRLKLSSEFTTARQRPSEDPNQFYLRLFNLGIQSGRSVDVEDYRTRLVKPLQNLINQHDRAYPTVQDIVAHAGRLWQTLDPNKVRQEIKEEKERIRQQRNPDRQDRQQQHLRKSNRTLDQQPAESSSHAQQAQQNRQDTRQGNKSRLSQDERQYRADKNLCFNCGHPGHRRDDCTYSFNPNRVPLRDDNQAKTQSFRGQKRSRVKAQPLHASDNEADPAINTTDDSDHDERANKRSKN
jgi:hypothetical protein